MILNPCRTPVVADVADQVVAGTESWPQFGLVSPTPPEIVPPVDEVVCACQVQPQAQILLP